MKIDEQIIKFLIESNAIEGEYDTDSLIQAIYAWNYVIGEKELTPSVVKRTHKILMLHHLVGNQKGYFREEPVCVGGREGRPYYAIPVLIENWCKSANETLSGSLEATGHVIPMLSTMIENDHVTYEKIHPFIDGNGRTGRIFLNWQRVKAGLPVLIITEKEKQEYYKWFR